ncbi:hypothetical protein AWENTII_005201 [Aspergillus wentii]|nr:hypothetical protein MW887_008745 [Aspergillus wentii]
MAIDAWYSESKSRCLVVASVKAVVEKGVLIKTLPDGDADLESGSNAKCTQFLYRVVVQRLNIDQFSHGMISGLTGSSLNPRTDTTIRNCLAMRSRLDVIMLSTSIAPPSS